MNRDWNNNESRNEEIVFVDENENWLLKIPMDVLIYEILAHYYLEINKCTILKMAEFSLLGYFASDPSRKIYFLFRNITIDDKCNFNILGSTSCPVMCMKEIERIRFRNYPYIHEFYELSISWLNLRELEIFHNLPIKHDAWFTRKDCFPSLERFTIVDNAVKLGIGKRGRHGKLGRTSRDRQEYLPLFPKYLQNVDEKLSNEKQTFDSSNFRNLKRLTFENYDELISTTLSTPSSFPMDCFKKLEEIRITRSKGRFVLSPLIIEKLTQLQLCMSFYFEPLIPDFLLQWTVNDVFPNLRSLDLSFVMNRKRISIYHECFPLLERLKLCHFNFEKESSPKTTPTGKCSLPPSLKFISFDRCSGEILVRNDLQLRNLEHLEMKNFNIKHNFGQTTYHSISTFERLVKSIFKLVDFTKLKTFVYENSKVSGSAIPWRMLCVGLEKLVMREILLADDDTAEEEAEKLIFPKMKCLDLLNVGWVRRGRRRSMDSKFGVFPSLETLDFLNNANYSLHGKETLMRGYRSFITIGRNTEIKRNMYIQYSTAGCFESTSSKIRVFSAVGSRGISEEEEIQNIRVGDLVESSDGKVERVVMVRHHRREKHSLMSVNGGMLVTTPRHLLYVYNPKSRSVKLISAKDLFRRYNILLYPTSPPLYLIDRLDKLVMIDSVEFLEEKKFVSNVYTGSGKIVVNGLVCSVFTSEMEKKLYVPNLLTLSLLGEGNNKKLRKFAKLMFNLK